jgi:hypothetical protein
MSTGLMLDLLIALIGFGAAVVMGILLWRMLGKKEQSPGGPVKLSFKSTKFSSAETVEEPLSPTNRARNSFPGLKAVQLKLEGTDKMLLQLENQGSALTLERIKIGENNELSIEPDPPLLQSSTQVYGPQARVNLILKGDKVIFKTYDFWLYYRNSKGQLLRQQIAGMGKEFPIIEAAEPAAS